MAGFDDVATPVPQTGGWESVATPYSSPKLPDMSGVQKMAQDNLVANDNKEESDNGEIKAPQTSTQRLDTAIGMPVNNLLNPDDDAPLPSPIRKNLTKAYANNTAVDAGDFMQTMLHSVVPIIAGAVHNTEAVGRVAKAGLEGVGEGYEGSALFPMPISSNVETMLGMAGNIPIQALGSAYSGFQSAAVQAGKEIGNPALGRDIALFPESMMGGEGMSPHPPIRSWGTLPGRDSIANVVAKHAGKDPSELSASDFDQAIAQGTNHKAPAAADFKAVETVTDGVLNEKTLHIVYNETGVKPDQVFQDAQQNPAIVQEVASGKIPEQYEHLVEEKPVLPPSDAEKLQVVQSDTGKSFNVVDSDGDHVSGGFDSAEEARHYIEDQKFKAEERAAIEEEGESTTQDVLTPESEKALEQPKPTENIYAGTEEKVVSMTADEQKLRLESLNKKMEAGIATPKEIGEREALSAKRQESEEFSSKYTLKPSTAKDMDIGTDKEGRHVYEVVNKDGVHKGFVDIDSIKDGVARIGDIVINSSEEPTENIGVGGIRDILRQVREQHPEIISIEGERVSGAQKGADALEYAHQISKEHGYLPKDEPNQTSRPLTDLQNSLAENGGRDVTRSADADRVAKALEAKHARENLDPQKIENEAYSAGLNTELIKDETPVQRKNRLLNELREFWKNQEGSGASDAMRQAIGGIINTAEKFVGKLTGGFFEKLGDAYVRTFQPELVGPLAKRADAFLAKFKAAQQEAENAFYRADAVEMKRFDRMSADERREWRYDHETGRWNEEENPDHAKEQAIYDAMHKVEKEAGVSDGAYKENYLPHQFENPDAVQKYFNSDAYIKKYGKDWFTKRSIFQLTQDAERAGFKLKTDNPIRMRIARQTASDNLLRTMDLLKDFEGSGVAKRATAFSIDKKIAKTEAAIAEIQGKYKKELADIEKQKILTDENGKSIGEPASKKMQIVQKRLDDLNGRLEDFKKEKAENKLTPEQMKELKGGFRVIGPDNKVWNIHQEVGPLWKNVMDSKGFWDDQGWKGDAYRGYMQAKAIWVSNKLALSLFHPSHMLGIHLSSGGATAMEHLIQGGSYKDLDFSKTSLRFGFGGKDTGVNPFTLNKDATLGFGRDHPAVVAWNTPHEMRTPEQQKIVTTMVEGGFKPSMSAQEAVHFKDNWNKAINGLGVNNLRLLGSATQAIGGLSAPLFQSWIPALKAESYLYRTELALKRDPSLAVDAGKRGEVYRQIAKDVDRNYGEMNQDTLFWDKTVRDAFNASMLSGGWKLAMIQNFRGLAEPGKVAYNFAKTGEFSKEQITHQMLQSYIYTGVMLAQGAIITKLLTGSIGGAIDWAFPDTGDKNPDGREIRLQQPAFLKEGFMLKRDINEEGLFSGTGKFLYHQTLIPGIAETLTNHDFVGREIISDPTDLHEWANAGWNSVGPITFSAMDKADQKGSETAKTMELLGFPLAGAYINQTAFEQKVLHKYSEENPAKGSVYESKLKTDLKIAANKHDSEEVSRIRKEMKEKGMTDKQISNATKTYSTPFVEHAWKELSMADQKRLIEHATDEEKKKFKVKSQ